LQKCQELLNFSFSDLFCNGKSLDPVHALWTTGSGQSTVDPHGGADGKPPESGNSSRLLKDFRKNIICHAMQCILYKIYFWEGFSYVLQFNMHFICTPICMKFYSCKKWVLQLVSRL
jgi:hypothetical protein